MEREQCSSVFRVFFFQVFVPKRSFENDIKSNYGAHRRKRFASEGCQQGKLLLLTDVCKQAFPASQSQESRCVPDKQTVGGN